MRVGGIVLCGGSSNRMGLPKAMLPFGSELMLQRVVRLLSQAVEPIVVVAAASQQLPELPPGIIVAHDEREGRGPLEGLRVGLTALASHTDAAYATSCDVPLLSPEFVRRMIAELAEYEAAVPVDGKFYHPLAACYLASTVARIERLVDRGELRTSDLFQQLSTNRVPVRELRRIDPELLTLMNVNTPADYANALALAGFTIDLSLKSRLGL